MNKIKINFLQKLNRHSFSNRLVKGGEATAIRAFNNVSQLKLDQAGFQKERIKKLENGAKYHEKCVFSDNEMDLRLNILENDIMNEMNLDYVLLTSQHNINYYTNYLYVSFGSKYGLFIDNNGIKTTITRNVDGSTPFRNQYHKIDNIVYTDWNTDNYFYAVATLMKKQNKNNIKIGVEYDHISLEFMSLLKQYLFNNNSNSNIEFVDVSKKIMEKRIIKSNEEHTLIRNGAHIANIAGYKGIEYLKECKANNKNISEMELSSYCTDIVNKEISKMYQHIDFRDSWTWIHCGKYNTDGAHNPPTLTNINYGDNITMNIFPMIYGYYIALERTLFYDHIPSDYHFKFWEINCKVFECGIDLIKPGIKCSEIANELNEIYLMETPTEFYENVFNIDKNENILNFRQFGYGHSFGILSPYYGRESGLELRECCDTVLKEGMVISMEPSLFIPNNISGYGTYREHDILIVNQNGNENITKFPFGSKHNVI